MDTTPNNLEHLFAQLGLATDSLFIENFINAHLLSDEEKIEDAAFWNEAQKAFLIEEKTRDAEWCAIIDVLNTLLHR